MDFNLNTTLAKREGKRFLSISADCGFPKFTGLLIIRKIKKDFHIIETCQSGNNHQLFRKENIVMKLLIEACVWYIFGRRITFNSSILI